MNLDTQVLRAMLRLARRRRTAEYDEVAARVDASASTIRAAVRRLEAAGFVELRPGRPARLTLSGLALAVSLVRTPPCARPARTTASRAA